MDLLSKKKVLVTGAGGFIGSHLVESLVRQGSKVTAFVHYNSRGDSGLLKYLPPLIRKEVEIMVGDLRDFQTILKISKNQQLIFHLGALIAIPYSYENPYSVVETNVLGTLNVLTASRINQVERVIHTSTSEVYGTAQYTPMNEKHPLQGQSPYSASKIAADKLAESYYCSYQLPVVTIRPFNTYGPRQSTRAVIPVIITQALKGNKILLGSTHTKRDFTYVDDTVNGFIMAADTEDILGQVFNLGTGQEISILEICELVSKILGKKLTIMTDESRIRPEKSEVQQLLSDNSFARAKLNWYPKCNLEDGLSQTIQWISDHLNEYKIGFYEI